MENEIQEYREKIEFDVRDFKIQARSRMVNRGLIPFLATFFSVIALIILTTGVFPWEEYKNITEAVSQGNMIDIKSFPWLKYFLFLLVTFIVKPIADTPCRYLASLLCKSPEPVKFSDYGRGFSFSGKALALACWKFLWYFLWSLLGILPGMIFVIVASIIIGKTGSGSVESVSTIGTYLIFIGFSVVYAIKYYSYSQADYAIIDDERVGVLSALKISKKITKGYRFKLFYLDLTYILWAIAGLFIPVFRIFILPYYRTTKYLAYRTLLENYSNSKK
ncbi:MAG: DUF975 family protein [Treponema sp.]|nr:DUF975 family protein [Treponema sp.]